MKKTAFVLGYAGSILALVFSMLMILTVPLNLTRDILDDMTDEFDSNSVAALNSMGIEMLEQGWTDYSKDGLIEIAEQAAEKRNYEIDISVYRNVARFAYEKGLTVLVSLIVVAAAIVLSLVALIATMIIKKAPAAGGILLLLTAFFLLLGSIYTKTFIPTFIASVFLALGGIAVFIPARMNRSVPAAVGSYAPPQGAVIPPQGGYAIPQNAYAPPQSTYVPQSAYPPPQSAYAPPQSGLTPPQYQEASGVDSGLPFPEEPAKPDDSEV